jgi:hypothetical protein
MTTGRTRYNLLKPASFHQVSGPSWFACVIATLGDDGMQSG